MQIGTFKSEGKGYSGRIETLTINVNVTLEPVRSDSERAPDYRVFRGIHQAGIGYKKTSDKGNTYIALMIDDPAFAKPVWCNLLLSDRDELPLMWDRPKNSKKSDA
jgi:uncharacterized protein (DUF736 family)